MKPEDVDKAFVIIRHWKSAAQAKGAKKKAYDDLKKSRPRQVKASYVDKTGGFSISSKNMLIRVLCESDAAQRRVLKALYALKSAASE